MTTSEDFADYLPPEGAPEEDFVAFRCTVHLREAVKRCEVLHCRLSSLGAYLPGDSEEAHLSSLGFELEEVEIIAQATAYFVDEALKHRALLEAGELP